MIKVGLYNYEKLFHIGIIRHKSFITGLDYIHETEFSVRCSESAYTKYIDHRCRIKEL